MVGMNNAGRLGAGFISVCLETRWLGHFSGLNVPERPCTYIKCTRVITLHTTHLHTPYVPTYTPTLHTYPYKPSQTNTLPTYQPTPYIPTPHLPASGYPKPLQSPHPTLHASPTPAHLLHEHVVRRCDCVLPVRGQDIMCCDMIYWRTDCI